MTEQKAREIIEHISHAAIEFAFMRHDLAGDDDIDKEEVKADVLACLLGDETGCLNPDDLDENNCERLWLQAQS